MAKNEIAVKKLTSEHVMTVRITNQFKARIFIAIRLVRMAAFVLGCSIKIIDEVNKGEGTNG
jgi:hypothetical protein